MFILTLLPFTYLAFPYFLSYLQVFDGLPDAHSDRRPVVPHGGQLLFTRMQKPSFHAKHIGLSFNNTPRYYFLSAEMNR